MEEGPSRKAEALVHGFLFGDRQVEPVGVGCGALGGAAIRTHSGPATEGMLPASVVFLGTLVTSGCFYSNITW